MKNRIMISPSVLACDFAALGAEVRDIAEAGAEMAHLDVMDGLFVNNISFGIPVIASLRKKTDICFDVHLMIDRPERYVERFAEAGADYIVFHLEATENAEETLKKIRSLGKKAGVSVKPGTPVETVYPLLPMCDMVLIMTVEPGFGGQKLIPETLDKVKKLKAYADTVKPELLIEVDGGINASNASTAIAAGANVLVAGSAVFGAADRRAAIFALRGENG